MTNEEYVALALRTDCQYSSRDERLLHAALGLATEAGEILDQLKRRLYYKKELDEVNLKEELGDLFWYAAVMADTLGITFEQAQISNIAKLQKRYGEKFSTDRALQRDLAAERQVLEG